MPIRRSDDPERRKLALMRAGNTRAVSDVNIAGQPRKYDAHNRPKPSLPKMPWDEKPSDDET